MPQIASSAALQALTEWWEDMGVEVDHAQIRALQNRFTPSNTRTSAKGLPVQAGQIPARTEAASPRRRGKTKTLEDWIAEAESLAAAASDLPSLKAAIEGFEGCPLKALCDKTVVYDGTPGAPVLLLGDGPSGQDDRLGLPFAGKAGQLLDRMLGAIGLDRKTNTFISNVNYWRPPGSRSAETDELAVCRPFVNRMVDLAQPKIIIASAGVAARSLLDTKTGLIRLRGSERPFATPAGTQAPLFPIFHPDYLLERPQDKSRAWRDLLLIQARLKEIGVEV